MWIFSYRKRKSNVSGFSNYFYPNLLNKNEEALKDYSHLVVRKIPSLYELTKCDYKVNIGNTNQNNLVKTGLPFNRR